MGQTIVIGGGPNGLAAALTLAQRGHSVTVLEARDVLGGRAAGEEFHPGFRTTGLLHDTERVQPWVLEALGLSQHGLSTQTPPDVLISSSADNAVALASDPQRAGQQLDAQSPGLGQSYQAWWADVAASAGLVRALSGGPPPDIASDADLWPLIGHGMKVLRLGRAKLMDLLRTGPLCAEDWLDEHFSHRELQAGVTLPGLMGTWMGPRSPTSAATVRFAAALAGQEISGGPAALVASMVAACAARGVQLKTGAEVSQIRLDANQVSGVVLADGTQLQADAVVSTVGPRRTLRDLIDPLVLPFAMDEASAPIRTRGIVAKLDLALSATPSHPAAPSTDWQRLRLVSGMEGLERAFDDAKHRRLPRTPALDIRLPSLGAPGLAPEGQHVASVLIFGAPHDLDGGWTAQAKAQLQEATMAVIEHHMPGTGALVVGSRLQTPADLETSFGLEGGHLFHGEVGLDQILSFRPHPRLSDYTTDIGGLFLGGAGMHPAGGFTCAQGVLAARAVG